MILIMGWHVVFQNCLSFLCGACSIKGIKEMDDVCTVYVREESYITMPILG